MVLSCPISEHGQVCGLHLFMCSLVAFQWSSIIIFRKILNDFVTFMSKYLIFSCGLMNVLYALEKMHFSVIGYNV
jgi:hypothetical protein